MQCSFPVGNVWNLQTFDKVMLYHPYFVWSSIRKNNKRSTGWSKNGNMRGTSNIGVRRWHCGNGRDQRQSHKHFVQTLENNLVKPHKAACEWEKDEVFKGSKRKPKHRPYSAVDD